MIFIYFLMSNVLFVWASPGADIVKEKPTLTYESGSSRVFVFDNLISPKLGSTFRNYLTEVARYTYTYPDPYENIAATPNSGNLHWKAYVQPDKLIKTRFWKSLRIAYKTLPDDITNGQKFLPYESYGTLLHRGHFPCAFKGDDDVTGKIFMRIFLTKGLSKHSYSDQAFYDKDDEIFASIYPKAYRIVVWTGNVSTLFRPPSMGHESDEFSFLVKLTSDDQLFMKAVEVYDRRDETRTQNQKKLFPFTNFVNQLDYKSFDPAKHLLGKYHDRNGEVIAFFDNVFPKKMLDELRTYLLNFQDFGHNPHDPATTELHDNVSWITMIKPEVIINTPIYHMIVRLSEYLSNKTTWFPYDVACNLIQHSHHVRIHTDCNFKEFEYTFLLYLNPNWTENLYAETSFYQYDDRTLNAIKNKGFEFVDGQGLEQYDFIAGAIPKYGRIALFRNLIPHTARPPAPNFLAARYTFPVKLSDTKEQARAKMLMELIDYKGPEVPEDTDYELLKEGYYEPYLAEDRASWVEKHIDIMRKSRDTNIGKSRFDVQARLFPKEFLE